MNHSPHSGFRIAEAVKRALNEGRAVVALESTVIAHGLPYPLNLETGLACEEAVRHQGAIPATIGIVAGVPTIGLSRYQIETFATNSALAGARIEKAGLNNLASLIVGRKWGGTTVASTIKLALAAGIQVFSTGGIGGVHRGAASTFDVSADLTALGRTPIVCVCSGAKAILDLPKTVEYLETLGVPIVGYRTDVFPAFYSRRSGLAVDVVCETPEQVAAVARCHWRNEGGTAVLVCVPVPAEAEIGSEKIEAATEEAMARAAEQGIRGKAVTPYLLAAMKEITGGKTLEANRALLVNNASVAAEVAVSLAGEQ